MNSVQLDHVVIAVRDPATAVGQLHRGGFRTTAGGQHPGFGTRNVMVRFDSAYLELISVTDAAEARAAGRGTLVDSLSDNGDGVVAFALRGIPVETVIHRSEHARLPIRGPVHMRRETASTGGSASWCLAIPYTDQYCGWWPFFIEWEAGGPGFTGYTAPQHPNGTTGIAQLTVAAYDLAPVRLLMETICRLTPSSACSTAPSSGSVTYDLGGTALRFVRTTGISSEQSYHEPTEAGQGVRAMTLTASGPRVHPPHAVGLSPDKPTWLGQILLESMDLSWTRDLR